MGLKDDNINLQINIGVSGAAASIQKLNDENMKLASSTREAKTRMAELKAQGEKNSDEYKQLEATIKANTTVIDENKNAGTESFNAKIKAFRRVLRGVKNITYFLFRLKNIYA